MLFSNFHVFLFFSLIFLPCSTFISFRGDDTSFLDAPLLFTTTTLYIVYNDEIFHFYPSTTFGSLRLSFQECPLACPATTIAPNVLVASLLIPQKKWLVLFLTFLCSYYSHLDKDWASPSPTSMACIKWSHLILTSFGWDAILVGHFSQRSLSGNPKINPLFLATTRPHPLIPLTCGPPPMYWLGISTWCLGPLCMLHFHLNMFRSSLHAISVASMFVWFCYMFWWVFNSCSVKEIWALGSCSLPFTPFLDWVLLGWRPSPS